MSLSYRIPLSAVIPSEGELQAMGRRRHQSCPIQRTRTKGGKNDSWFIRYRIDVITAPGETEYKEAPPKYLGFCRDIGKREAERLRDEFLAAINSPATIIPSQVKFGSVLQRYLDSASVAGSSLVAYRSTANAHIEPRWGNVRICDITQLDVEQWLASKSRTMAKDTFQKIKTVMGCAWTAALRWGYTRDANPISLLPDNFGRTKPSLAIVLPRENDFQRLIGEMAEPYRLLAQIMAGTGLRVSEALGLRWCDFDADVVTVTWTMEQSSKQRVARTKTKLSARPIPIGHLREMVKMPAGAMPTDWIFDIRYKDVQHEVIRAAQAVGIYRKGFGCHMFRRWHNTMFRRISKSPELAMAQLGHGDRKTNDLYFYEGDEEMAKRAAVAAELMGKVTGGVQ